MAQPKIAYDNRLSDATPAASTTATGYDVLNLRDWRPYTWWQPTALPATVTVDCGSAQSVDYWLIYGHDLNTQGATIELRGSTDNFSASDVQVDTVTPSSDDPFYREVGSVSYRYWRIRITGSTMPSIAIAAMGEVLTIPSYLNEGFDPIGRDVVGRINKSQKGHALGAIIDYEKWDANLRFPLVSWSWVRSTWEPAWEAHLRSTPFVFVWEADSYASELKLVSTDGKFNTPHKAGSYADLDIKVMGVYS